MCRYCSVLPSLYRQLDFLLQFLRLSVLRILWGCSDACTRCRVSLVSEVDWAVQMNVQSQETYHSHRARRERLTAQLQCRMTCRFPDDKGMVDLLKADPGVDAVLRRGSATASLLALRARVSRGAWIFFSCECCVLSARGLCPSSIGDLLCMECLRH